MYMIFMQKRKLENKKEFDDIQEQNQYQETMAHILFAVRRKASTNCDIDSSAKSYLSFVDKRNDNCNDLAHEHQYQQDSVLKLKTCD